MRVVSLVPSATEIIAALGLAGQPRRPLARVQLPARGAVGARSSRRRASTRPRSRAPQIDRAVRDALGGRPAALRDRRRAARELAPDLIVTQDLCEVCAVPSGDVQARRRTSTSRPISLDPRDLERDRGLDPHDRPAPRTPPGRASCSRRTCTTASTTCTSSCAVSRARACSSPSGSIRRSRPGTGCPRWSSLAGGDEVLGRPRERSFADDLGGSREGCAAADRARALRLRSRAHRERGRRACPRWARASSPSTATRPTRGRARASPRASRSSRTCCIPTTCRRRRCRRASWPEPRR